MQRLSSMSPSPACCLFLLRRCCRPRVQQAGQSVLMGVASTSPCSPLFTDAYLGVDKFSHYRNAKRLALRGGVMGREVGDPGDFVSGVRATFAESGVRYLFADDIARLVDVAETEEDARLAGEVLRASLREEDGGRPIPDLPKFISRFFSLCLKENFLRLAQEMWESPEINKTGFKRILRNLRIKYLTLLYRNGSHQEVSDCYTQMDPNSRSLDDATLAMASLYKLGTNGDFRQATELLHKPPITLDDGDIGAGGGLASSSSSSSSSSFPSSSYVTRRKNFMRREAAGCRGIYIYTYFAAQKGEYGSAYDILTDRRYIGRNNRLSTNIKLVILSKVGRLEEAMSLIKAELLPVDADAFEREDGKRRRRSRRHVCFEAMETLAKAIKENRDPDSHVTREFALLCRSLDETAVLREESMEELLFEPIEPRWPSGSERTERRKDRNGDPGRYRD